MNLAAESQLELYLQPRPDEQICSRTTMFICWRFLLDERDMHSFVSMPPNLLSRAHCSHCGLCVCACVVQKLHPDACSSYIYKRSSPAHRNAAPDNPLHPSSSLFQAEEVVSSIDCTYYIRQRLVDDSVIIDRMCQENLED